MKKLMYLFLAALVCGAVVSCSDDDGDDKKGGGKVTFVRPSSIDIAGAESSTKIQYTMSGDKVSKVVIKTIPADLGPELTYNVDNSTAGKIVVKYFDNGDGEDVTLTYTLDAKGRPVTAKTLYDSDQTTKDSYIFEYDTDGMLTLIKDVKDSKPVNQFELFSASYNKEVMTGCKAAGIGNMTFKYSKTINNCIVDPSMLYFIYETINQAPANLAVILGLLPVQSKCLPTNVILGGDEEEDASGTDVNVVVTMNGDKLSKYALDVDGAAVTAYTYNY